MECVGLRDNWMIVDTIPYRSSIGQLTWYTCILYKETHFSGGLSIKFPGNTSN